MPTIVGVGAGTSGTGDITPAFPAGYTAVDLDIAVTLLECEGADTIAVPANWALITDAVVSTGTTTKLAVIWRRLAAGNTAPLIADNGRNHTSGRMIVLRGCVTTGDPWDLFSNTTELVADTTVSIPGVTTGGPNRLIMTAFGTGQDTASTAGATGWTNANLASLTERMDNWVSAGLGGGFAMATGEKAVAGATGATTATLSLTANFKTLITISFVGASDPGPQLTVTEASWTTTTTPKTTTDAATGNGDILLHLGGGDQTGANDVTAATSSTSAGSTSAWTELAEDLSGTTADWMHGAWAAATATGSVTTQMARTSSGTPPEWGYLLARAASCGGIGNVATQFTASATQVVSLTVSQNSAVVLLACDWDAGAIGSAWVPATNAQLIERAVEASAYTVHAAYWPAQAAGTRDYGFSGAGGAAHRIIAVELLALGAVTGDASFAGTATISAAAVRTAATAVALTATATITSGAQAAVASGAALMATATAITTGFVTRLTDAAITGTAVITAAGFAVLVSAATLAGSSSITTEGVIGQPIGADLVATATLAAAGFTVAFAVATLATTATVTTSGFTALISGTELIAAAVLVAAGITTRSGAATVAGTATIIAIAFLARSSAATVVGTASIVVSGVVGALAVYVATATITTAGTPTLATGAALLAVATVTAVSVATFGGAAELSATAVIAAGAAAALVAGGALTGLAVLVASAAVTAAYQPAYVAVEGATGAGGVVESWGTVSGLVE